MLAVACNSLCSTFGTLFVCGSPRKSSESGQTNIVQTDCRHFTNVCIKLKVAVIPKFQIIVILKSPMAVLNMI